MNKELPKIDHWQSFWAFAEVGILSVIFAIMLSSLLSSISSGDPNLLVALIAGVVHLVGYSIVGLPLFLIYWPKPWSRVWKWYFALPLGLFLGATPLLIMKLYDSYVLLIVSGIYGVVTAVTALWVNKKRR